MKALQGIENFAAAAAAGRSERFEKVSGKKINEENEAPDFVVIQFSQ